MALVRIDDMLDIAAEIGCSLPTHEVDGIQGILRAVGAAERHGAPLVLAVSAARTPLAEMELILPAAEAAARAASVPAGILVADCPGAACATAAVRLGAMALSAADDADGVAEIAEACGVPLVAADAAWMWTGPGEGPEGADATALAAKADGTAARFAEAARPWRTVEHLIYFNSSTDAETTEDKMAIGVEALSRIPGVRSVVAGRRIAGKESYQYCWVVRLASREALDTYTTHPLHVAYADDHFRPIADDRITIDFEPVDGGEA